MTMAYIFFNMLSIKSLLYYIRYHNSVMDMLFAFGAEVPLWSWVRTLFGANVGASPTVPKNIIFSKIFQPPWSSG